MKYLLLAFMLGSAYAFDIGHNGATYSIEVMPDGTPCGAGQNFLQVPAGESLCTAIRNSTGDQIGDSYNGWSPGGCWRRHGDSAVIFSSHAPGGLPAEHMSEFPAELYCITAIDGAAIVPGCMDERYEEFNDAATGDNGSCETLSCAEVPRSGCLKHDSPGFYGISAVMLSQESCISEELDGYWQKATWCTHTFEIAHEDHTYSIEVKPNGTSCDAGQNFLQVPSADEDLCTAIRTSVGYLPREGSDTSGWSPGGCWIDSTYVVFSSHAPGGLPAPHSEFPAGLYCITEVDGEVPGCMDPLFTEYNPAATVNYGSCATLKCAQPTCDCETPAEYIDAQCCQC